MRILHAIHDFLPRHRAGSEIYAFELCRALEAAHHVTVLCADYDPSRPHGHVAWRACRGPAGRRDREQLGCASFEETYRLAGDARPDRACAARRAAGCPPRTQPPQFVVRPSRRWRARRASRSWRRCTTTRWSARRADSGSIEPTSIVCEEIDPARCARCFGESAFARSDFARQIRGATSRAPDCSAASRSPCGAAYPAIAGGLQRIRKAASRQLR